MSKKRYNAEQTIHKLGKADVLLGQGNTVTQVCQHIGVTDQTYYRWRKAYGGMKECLAVVEGIKIPYDAALTNGCKTRDLVGTWKRTLLPRSSLSASN